MAEKPPLQATKLLGKLIAAEVDFVVIGGVALSLHGADRPTKDLDICFGTDRENLERLGGALLDLKARLWGIDRALPFVPDAATLSRLTALTLRTRLGLLDLLAFPDGAPRYGTLAGRASRTELGGGPLLYASLDHLIAMKEAAGRPQDLADIESLKAIRRLQRGDPARDSFGRTAEEALREIDDT